MLKHTEQSGDSDHPVPRVGVEAAAVEGAGDETTLEEVAALEDEVFAREIEAYLGANPTPRRIADAEEIRDTARVLGVGFRQAIAIREQRNQEARARLDPTPARAGLLDYTAGGLVAVL